MPAVVRIDNLKTGVARGAGPWGQVNEAHRAYAKGLASARSVSRPQSPPPFPHEQ